MKKHTYLKPILLFTVFLGAVLFVPIVSPKGSSEEKIQSPGLKPVDIFSLEYAADPQISPDGERIVNVRQFSDIMTDRRYSNLWIVNFDGGNHRPLTSGKRYDSSPRWSPGGTRIAYISSQDNSPQIYLRWMDTGQTSKLTNLTSSPSGLSWSPDGAQIAFRSIVKANPLVIAALPKPPEGAKWAEPAKIIDRVYYRADGAGYLPYGYTHLFVIPSEGGTPRQISSGNFHHNGEIVWTLDGRHLLVSANRRDDFEYEPRDTEIYEFSVADGSFRPLTDRRGPDSSPAISPDGKLIAYLGFDDRYRVHQITQLNLMDSDGTDARVLTPKLDRDVSSPHWASDGKGLYFVYIDQGNSKLGYVSLGGKIEELADSLGSGYLAYGAGATFSVAQNGNFAITQTHSDLPGDIAAASFKNRRVRLVTHVNADLLSQRELAKAEEIWYESSHDGREIHGWILKPPGFDPQKKYPLVLEIHGGPSANYGDRFDIEKQMLAASSYVVLYTNPRGSTSYGEEFGDLIHHAYPGDDFYDLNSGVDAMLEKDYIDSNNIFVCGGSGGGVLTCWMIGRSNRFRAAVSLFPVINWYSFVLTTDMAVTAVKYWFPGLPWDHVEHYEKRSLLSVVKNVKTPTIVITGEEDYRTPMSESEQYYMALKLQKVDSMLVRYPGNLTASKPIPATT